ncbi:MAG TPA: hypothetical protein PKD31_09745, partial [Blastocatellia bacterium]|nr:hypothetical protein [Blastocatellia bacterium]
AAAVCFRDLADRMMYLFYVARLAVEAAWEMANKQSLGKAAVIEWLMQNRVEKNAAKASANYLQQISEISSKL